MPRSAVPDMLAAIEEIAARHGVTIATVAHAGDGNLHPLILCPPGDDAARAAAQAAFEEMLAAAIALGGTVTGEHGVGLLKRGGMRQELSARGAGHAAGGEADPRPAATCSTPARSSATPDPAGTGWLVLPATGDPVTPSKRSSPADGSPAPAQIAPSCNIWLVATAMQ